MNRWLIASLLLCLQSGLLAVDSQSASVEPLKFFSDPRHGYTGEKFQPFIRVDPDPNAPLVAIEVWVQAGSAYETRETSGAAHLLEHLIFKGTAQHPPGALDAVVESAGGILEASTEREWTRYRMAVLPEQWEPALRMLMEHLLHPALPEAELQRERELILQDEYALHRADPVRVARYALYAQIYGEHPYALPPLGIPGSLAKLSREQLMAFHAHHYRPERMVIVVAGPVEPARVQQLIRSLCPAKKDLSPCVEVPKAPSYRVQEGMSEGEVRAIGVIAPSASQPDAMLAAEVIHLALAEPYLGLLWASSPTKFFSDPNGYPGEKFQWLIVSSEYIPRLQSGLMLFFFQPYPDAPHNWWQQVRDRWEAAIRQIVGGEARSQLEGAKQRLIARHQAMRNPLERARLYAFYATLGLPNLPDEYASRLQSLPIEQIEKVAQAIFSEDPLVQALPLHEATDSPPRSQGGQGWETVFPSRFPTDRERNQQNRSEEALFRQTLANGVRAIALHQPGAKQLVLQVLIAVGTDAERDFPPGTSELTARMLFTVTHNETQASLAYRIARSGGSLLLHWEPIGVRITAVAEPATIENVLSLLKEGLTRAEFTPDALKNALQAALAERHRMDSMQELPLYDALFRQFYHASLYASAEQLQQVCLEHIKAFYRRYYRHDRFVMVIAGDLPVERLTELMQRYFGSVGEPIPPPQPSPSRGREFSARPPADFTVKAVQCPSNAPTLYIGFGLRAPVRSPEEYAALLVLQAVLCEGKGSALFRQFREAHGIGYAFGSSVIVWGGEGVLLGFLQLGSSRTSQREELLNRLQAMLRQQSPMKFFSDPKGYPEEKFQSPDALRRALALVEGRWRRDQMDIFERTRRLAIAEASGIGYLAEVQLPDLLKKIEAGAFSTQEGNLPSKE